MFDGYENTNENWVLSLTSLSGTLNGSTRTYLDVIQPEDGKSFKPICLLQICKLGAIIYDWLDISWLKSYYCFGFDHFNMSWRRQAYAAGLPAQKRRPFCIFIRRLDLT
ncbi:hypothetical protein Bca52824_033768 [Brassica carinata]|uniref:Uncharacterized protein n=1 Tax=Brassica carinata TaxID=52824 RepID=A0A8X7V7N4_BRACI|nr:hypothetical protein Bca52824_033768 [Brassica carinata]